MLDAVGRHAYLSGDQSYEMASTAKVDILLALLMHATEEERELTAQEDAHAREMIGRSDNDAAWSLYRRMGSEEGVSRLWEALGMTGMIPEETSWGLMQTTLADRLRILDVIVRGHPLIDPRLLSYGRSLLAQVDAEQVWGVGDAARDGEGILVKNGWLPRSTDDFRWIVNSTGLIRSRDTALRLAVYTKGSATKEDGIALVCRLLATARETLRV
ncbi:MAG: class A beta-lactamase-related serine hydrolase [Micrococcales bacterium]|nr:class A beta-lactamase-related serine hydrolase [Micrococcales bacterium]